MTNRVQRGAVGRKVTLQQRRILLERLRADVARVVEDVEAATASLRAVAEEKQPRTATETATLRLLEAEQRRNQLELRRLYQEYEGLAFRVSGKDAKPAQAA